MQFRAGTRQFSDRRPKWQLFLVQLGSSENGGFVFGMRTRMSPPVRETTLKMIRLERLKQLERALVGSNEWVPIRMLQDFGNSFGTLGHGLCLLMF